MRCITEFAVGNATLVATIDEGHADAGLLIVSGGNEIRIGAHRGMAILAQAIAKQGFPVFRFDRRGVGDSDGENGGFESSGPDIRSAISAFRSACPQLRRVVAFGNCDAATALILHAADFDEMVLANPWVVEPTGGLPPRAAILDRYARRLRDPDAWRALITLNIDLGKAFRGVQRLLTANDTHKSLADRVATALANDQRPTTILLATDDNTAIAFASAWRGQLFKEARGRSDVKLIRVATASHSFASDEDFSVLTTTLTAVLVQ